MEGWKALFFLLSYVHGERVMNRYRLLVGGHSDENGTYHAQHKDVSKRYVRTELDLVKKFGREKFRQVDDQEAEAEIAEVEENGEGVHTNEELENMSAKELKKYAETLEIPVDGLNRKEDLIRAIKSAESGVL